MRAVSALARALGAQVPNPQRDQLHDEALAELVRRLGTIARLHELEYGRVPCELAPHDRTRSPATRLAELAEAESVSWEAFDLVRRDHVTSGHVANVGTGYLSLVFVGFDGSPWTYRLPASGVLRFDDLPWESLEVTAAEDGAAAQLLAR